jgi:ParB family chromosome partitioning protein
MSGVGKFLAKAGANIGESIGSRPATGVVFPGETTPATPAKFQGAARVKDALAIELGRIVPDPDQPRKDFDPGALEDLAASLKARGQLQPIRVRWDEPMGMWVIIAGERRYRAAQMAGLETLLCVEAKGPLTPDEILEDQLVENCLREDLRPIDQAKAFKALLDRRGWTYRQLAETLHIAAASVAKALALLEAPTAVRELVEAEQLAPSVAYEIGKVPDRDEQTELARRAVAEGLNRAEVVAEVRRVAGGKGRPKGSKGRGAARKVTERTLRVAGGKVTVENRKGLDDATILAMLREAADQVEARSRGDAADAA